jgi:hypothetical protein
MKEAGNSTKQTEGTLLWEKKSYTINRIKKRQKVLTESSDSLPDSSDLVLT